MHPVSIFIGFGKRKGREGDLFPKNGINTYGAI
jgi:hypothetical protein